MGDEKNAVRLSDIQSYIETLAPLACQESYDNSGLLLGNPDAFISKVLVCLDADENALDFAADHACQLILSHHPAIFKAVKVFTGDRREGSLLIKAIRQDIAIYGAHTNFDSVRGGLSDLLCERIGLNDVKILRESPLRGDYGSGRYGTIRPVSGDHFIKMLKDRLLLKVVRLIGNVPERVSKAAVYNGSFDPDISKELNVIKPDVLITGDVKYHDAQELARNGVFTIDAGHYGTERIFTEEMASMLERRFPDLTVLRYEGADVFTYY